MADDGTLSLEDLLGNLSTILQLILVLGTLEKKIKKIQKLADKIGKAIAAGDLVKAQKKYDKLMLTVNEILASLNLGSLDELLSLLGDDDDE